MRLRQFAPALATALIIGCGETATEKKEPAAPSTSAPKGADIAPTPEAKAPEAKAPEATAPEEPKGDEGLPKLETPAVDAPKVEAPADPK